MTKEGQHILDTFSSWPLRQIGPCDHHDGQAEFARGIDLGSRAAASRIARDDPFDAARPHQVEIAGKRERTARHDHARIGQRQRCIGRIDKSQSVGVLRLAGESREMLSADSEEHAGPLVGQGGRGGRLVDYLDPVIARIFSSKARAPARSAPRRSQCRPRQRYGSSQPRMDASHRRHA